MHSSPTLLIDGGWIRSLSRGSRRACPVGVIVGLDGRDAAGDVSKRRPAGRFLDAPGEQPQQQAVVI